MDAHILAAGYSTTGWVVGYTIGIIIVLVVVALVGELDGLPGALAVTDETVKEVSVGAVRYAGSVAKLLG